MATHNLHTFLKNESSAIAINLMSGNMQKVTRNAAMDYITSEDSRQANNGCVVSNPAHADENVVIIVFAADESDKTIPTRANEALFEIREAARLNEIAELEARLAELKAKG